MKEIKIAPKDDWRLDRIELKFKAYGENKGKYEGSISFENGEFESFKFNIKPNMAQSYINLISDDVVKCAESLGERLINSLGLRE